jgi:dihydroorotate dehydrogenase
MKFTSKPWLYLPPETAHRIAPYALKLLARFRDYKTLTWKPFGWRHLEFNNRLGIAGGVDKNAFNVEDWWTFGCGFIEIGTVTPLPQLQNEGPVLDRDFEKKLLWNKLGFPNEGMAAVKSRLQTLKRPHFTPLFVNIGKNRTTPNESATSDYVKLIENLKPVADVFVVNISSPNTSGLRELLKPENLSGFLKPIIDSASGSTLEDNIPVLLKLSPDMSEEELNSAILTSKSIGVAGWILTNTTLGRPEGSKFSKEGGLSGKFLQEASIRALKVAVETLGNEKGDTLLISAGGVLTPNDVFERLKIGADLVQVYTALAFEGPNFFQNVSEVAQTQYSL